MIAIKLVLTVLYSQKDSVNLIILNIATLASGLLWCTLYIYFAPYYKVRACRLAGERRCEVERDGGGARTQARVNCIEAAMGAVFLWACICLTIAQLVTHADSAGSSLSAACAGAGQRVGVLAYSQPNLAWPSRSGRQLWLVDRLVVVRGAGVAFWGALPFVAFTGYCLVPLRLEALLRQKEVPSPLLVELKARVLLATHPDSPKALEDVDALYQASMAHFSSSSIIHVFYAHFLHSYKKNRHLEMAQLAAAERKEPALDELFLIYQRRRQVRRCRLVCAQLCSAGLGF
jgi:hypothetical protein